VTKWAGSFQNCVLLHTPEISHQQVDLVGQKVNEGFDWSVSIEVNGVAVPITAINQELPMSYLNVNLPLVGTLLYTRSTRFEFRPRRGDSPMSSSKSMASPVQPPSTRHLSSNWWRRRQMR